MLERTNRAFASRLRVFRKKVTHADLTNAVNGTAQAIAIGTLPAGAVVQARAVKLTTFFTGGGATTCTMAIGVSGTAAKFMTALNVLDTTTTAVWLQGTAGSSPLGPAGGDAIIATFTPDAGHTLDGLTAGEIDVEIYYSVPDAGA